MLLEVARDTVEEDLLAHDAAGSRGSDAIQDPSRACEQHAARHTFPLANPLTLTHDSMRSTEAPFE